MGISHSLPLGPHLIRGTHPLPLVQPHVHQGQSLGGGSSRFVGERGNRASFSSFSRLLQPAVCGDEGLGVVEAGHRPFVTESEGSEDFFQDGDSPVGTSFGSGWRLDGVSRLERCILASSDASDSRKFLRFVAFGKVYQFRVLCFGLSTAPQVFMRVMAPVSALLHRSSICLCRYLDDRLIQASSWEQVLLALDTVLQLCHSRHCRQLGEDAADSNSADGLSGSSPGLYLFQGFSCPKESQEASLNWRRILVLRRAASVILARALRSSVFNDSAFSGRTASDAVSSISPPSFLGSFRPNDPYQLGSRDPSGSGVVAESRSLGTRYFARSGVPSAQLVVRRLGRGLGGSSRGRGHFRPLVSRGSSVIYQCQRALGCRERSSLFLLCEFQTPR